MLNTLQTLVTGILQHPIVNDPMPRQSSFTDQNVYRLFLQFRNALFRLGSLTLGLIQGRRLLQFLPGSPRPLSPGSNRPLSSTHKQLPHSTSSSTATTSCHPPTTIFSTGTARVPATGPLLRPQLKTTSILTTTPIFTLPPFPMDGLQLPPH